MDDLTRTGVFASALRDLQEAWEIVRALRPVAARLPAEHPTDRKDWPRWSGPMTPRGVMLAARHAEPGDSDYITQLIENTTHHHNREASKDGSKGTPCGRPGVSGRACELLASYAPGGAGYAGGLPCWRHLTNDEREHLKDLYRQAISTIACPGCDAPAETNCRFGEENHPLRRIDGEWPRRRHIGSVEVHDVRLDLLSA